MLSNSVVNSSTRRLTARATARLSARPLSSPVNGLGWSLLRRLLRAVLRPVFRLRGFTVEGQEHWPSPGDGPRIVVANHAAFMDSVYLILASPESLTICGAKPRLFRNGRLRAVMALANILKVEHHDQFLADCGRLLGAGHGLLIYPEMGRNADHMGPFKTWAAEVALAHRASVVPCYLYGTTEGHRGAVQLRVGRPLNVDAHGSTDAAELTAAELTAAMRRAIEALAAETPAARGSVQETMQ